MDTLVNSRTKGFFEYLTLESAPLKDLKCGVLVLVVYDTLSLGDNSHVPVTVFPYEPRGNQRFVVKWCS